MTRATNPYCDALGIELPRLELARHRPDANYYSLLIVALLEKGEPITLQEAARRFEAAGVAPADSALASLKRCKPGRSPIYRDGDLYALDPHDAETDLWAFRLGLRPPGVPRLRVVRPEPGPLPSADSPLSVAQLEEAWREGTLSDWSAQRLALCVLDAHGGTMASDAVVAFVAARSSWNALTADAAKYWRSGAAVRVRDDGTWELNPGHDALRSARQAVRGHVERLRRRSHRRTDPAVVRANRKHFERKSEKHRRALARMRRVLIHAFPARQPEMVVLIDVAERNITTFVGEEIQSAIKLFADYEIIAAVEMARGIRAVARKRREDLVVVMHAVSRKPATISKLVEDGLGQLGLEYLDVLLLGNQSRAPSPALLDQVAELKQQGKLRFLGLSTHQRPLIPELERARQIDIYHVRYNAAHRGAEAEVFDQLPDQAGPGIVSFTSNRWGSLMDPARMPPGEPPPSAADCCRFVLTHPRVHVTCCGPANVHELRQNLECLDRGPMSDEELERMRRIGRHVYESCAPWRAQLGAIVGLVSQRLRGTVSPAR